MKKFLSIAMAVLYVITYTAFAQTAPPITTSQINQPVFGENPLQVNSAAVQVTGNPGPQTIYYWIVANYTVGATAPSGPFIITTAPNSLSSSNFVTVIPQYPQGAISVDVLKTSANVQPSGVCNCAVATAVTSGPIQDQSDAVSSYTVNPVNIALLGITLTNEVISAGVSHEILRQNGVFVSDLSNIGPGGGPVTSVFGRVGAVVANTGDYAYSQVTGAIGGTGTANCIAVFSDTQAEACSSLTDDGTTPTQIPNGAIFGANGIGVSDPSHAGAVFVGQGPQPSFGAANAVYLFGASSIANTLALQLPAAIGDVNDVLTLTAKTTVGGVDVGTLGFAPGGGGGGGVTGSGTIGTIPIWTSTSAIGDSPITYDGTDLVAEIDSDGTINLMSVASDASAHGTLQVSGGTDNSTALLYSQSDTNSAIGEFEAVFNAGIVTAEHSSTSPDGNSIAKVLTTAQDTVQAKVEISATDGTHPINLTLDGTTAIATWLDPNTSQTITISPADPTSGTAQTVLLGSQSDGILISGPGGVDNRIVFLTDSSSNNTFMSVVGGAASMGVSNAGGTATTLTPTTTTIGSLACPAGQHSPLQVDDAGLITQVGCT